MKHSEPWRGKLLPSICSPWRGPSTQRQIHTEARSGRVHLTEGDRVSKSAGSLQEGAQARPRGVGFPSLSHPPARPRSKKSCVLSPDVRLNLLQGGHCRRTAVCELEEGQVHTCAPIKIESLVFHGLKISISFRNETGVPMMVQNIFFSWRALLTQPRMSPLGVEVKFLAPRSFFFLIFTYLVTPDLIYAPGFSIFMATCGFFSDRPATLSCLTWDLVPQPGIEPRPPVLRIQSPSHWTTREVP